MRLSQSELEEIRRRQNPFAAKKKTVVSKKRNSDIIANTASDVAVKALAVYDEDLAKDIAALKTTMPDGVTANPLKWGASGLATLMGGPMAGSAVAGGFQWMEDNTEVPGETEFMQALGYTGGQWSLSGIWAALSLGSSTRQQPFFQDKLAYERIKKYGLKDAYTWALTDEQKPRFNEAMKKLRLKGSGDYTLVGNSLVRGGGEASENLQIVPAGPRAVRVTYREYLGDVYTHPTTAGAFSITSYDLNPGLVSTFPWLAPIAQQFEQWTPNGIVFEFKSTSSEYVATQALGSVIMATEYDQFDSVYTTKQEMLNAAYSSECKPSCNSLHGVECAPMERPTSILYVRSTAVPALADVRDYDCGRFSIATQGGAAANLNLGSLYVHYDITFRKEQLFGGIAAKGLLYDCITSNTAVSGVTSASPLPTIASGNIRTAGSIPIMTIGGLGTTVIFPGWIQNGRWKIEYYFTATSPSEKPAAAFTTNCALATLVSPSFNTLQNPVPYLSAGQNTGYIGYIFDITGPNAVITFSGATLTAPRYFAQISVTQLGTFPGYT